SKAAGSAVNVIRYYNLLAVRYRNRCHPLHHHSIHPHSYSDPFSMPKVT
ncbi:hypothetical protein X975_17488, partial [Stegodyphus mimosarum]